MEFRVVWPDGSVHWIDDKAKAFFDDDGKPLYMTGACADITSRKEAAEALRENEERLRAIFNQAAVGIAVATLDGHFLDMNQQVLGDSGLQRRRAPAPDVRGDHPPRRSDATPRPPCGSCSPGSIPEYSLEKRYVRKDGSIVWSLTTVTLLKDAAGQPQRFIGVIEDITARKRAEAALREETRILELLNETGRTLASKLDLQALVQAVTDAATQLSGAQFGAFFYNTTDENGDAFLLYTLVGRAARGVREVRQASRDGAVRPDVSRRSADPL